MMFSIVESKRQLILNDDKVSKSKILGSREKSYKWEILAPGSLNLLDGDGQTHISKCYWHNDDNLARRE